MTSPPVVDFRASKKFYDAMLGALGMPPGNPDDEGRVFHITKTEIFAITKPINGTPASAANGATCEGRCLALAA